MNCRKQICDKDMKASSKKIFGLFYGKDGKEFSCNAGNPGLIPGLGRSPEEENGYPSQYSFLENFMDRGPWHA